MSYDPKNPQQNWLPDYVRDIADKFNLRDWEFRLDTNSINIKGAAIGVECITGRQVACISFDNRFWNLTRQEQRYLIVHELVHVHEWPTMKFVAERLDSRDCDALREWEEYSTDSIAAAVAEFMPLPPKVRK